MNLFEKRENSQSFRIDNSLTDAPYAHSLHVSNIVVEEADIVGIVIVAEENDCMSSSDNSWMMVTTGSCSVCGQDAHGIHFGAKTCRPCAAFFRRTVVLDRRYKCKRDEKCRIAKDVRILCGKCRYDKCLAVGMTTGNVQFTRDRIPIVDRKGDLMLDPRPTEGEEICELTSYNSSVEDAQLTSRNSYMDDSGRLVLDVIDVSNRIIGVLQNYTTIFEYTGGNELKRMCIATDRMRAQQWKHPKMITMLHPNLPGLKWEDQLVKTAHWMMHCEEFVDLPFDEKKSIFREKWRSIERFDSCLRSVEIFGEETYTKLKICFLDGYAVSEATQPGVMTEQMKSLKNTFHSFCERMLRDICRPLFELQVTAEEQTFMLSNILWSIENCDVSESTKQVADEFRERLSSDLHDYYISEKKIANYSQRFIKIMEILRTNEKIQRERSRMMEMARFFDLFKLTQTNTEILDFERC